MRICWLFHDWTEENIKILPAPLDRIENVKNISQQTFKYLATQPVLATEVCRRCGKKRTRKIQ